MSPRRVAWHYTRSWFIIDLVAALPSDYIVNAITSGEVNNSLLKASRALRLVRSAKFLSLLKLLRISRLIRFMQTWEEVLHARHKYICTCMYIHNVSVYRLFGFCQFWLSMQRPLKQLILSVKCFCFTYIDF